MPGHHGLRFSSSLTDDQICSICNFALKDPYRNTISGQINCCSCVKDEDDFEDYVLDESKTEEMLSLQVVCCSDEECKGTLKDMTEVNRAA